MIVNFCIGFAWQGFGSWGATGVASVRSCWKLPLCPTEPIPAGSKMDLLPAKAEPISDSGSTSGRTDLRRGAGKPVQWKVLPLSLMGFALAGSRSVLEPADIGSVGHGGSF